MKNSTARRLREYHRQVAVISAWNSALNHCNTLEEAIRKHRRKGTLDTPAFRGEIKSVYQQTRSQFHAALPSVSKPNRHWHLLYRGLIKDSTPEKKRSHLDTFRLTSSGFRPKALTA